MLAYVKKAYHAEVALAFVAQASRRPDGAAILDQLRALGSWPGTVMDAGPRGVANTLRILANRGEIDYEGASGSVHWDENGDQRRRYFGVWRFTGNDRIEEARPLAFEK